MADYKTIYSLKVKMALKELGIEPILEKPNSKKEGLLCWVYVNNLKFR